MAFWAVILGATIVLLFLNVLHDVWLLRGRLTGQRGFLIVLLVGLVLSWTVPFVTDWTRWWVVGLAGSGLAFVYSVFYAWYLGYAVQNPRARSREMRVARATSPLWLVASLSKRVRALLTPEEEKGKTDGLS